MRILSLIINFLWIFREEFVPLLQVYVGNKERLKQVLKSGSECENYTTTLKLCNHSRILSFVFKIFL